MSTFILAKMFPDMTEVRFNGFGRMVLFGAKYDLKEGDERINELGYWLFHVLVLAGIMTDYCVDPRKRSTIWKCLASVLNRWLRDNEGKP